MLNLRLFIYYWKKNILSGSFYLKNEHARIFDMCFLASHVIDPGFRSSGIKRLYQLYSSRAIELDGRNAVYYCNRAAVHSKLGNHTLAIKDCHTALAIDPSYSKAYGRLGLAYSGLDKHKEAKESYEKALAMEPDNESYRNNLQLTEEKLAHLGVNQNMVGGLPGMDLSALLSNQALMNMARQMLSDPAMQNMMCNLMAGNVEEGGRMGALIEV